MSARGRKRHREPWREVLAHDLRDESEDERCDYADDTRPEPAIDPDTGRNNVDAILARRVKAVDSPEIGTDGDDSPTYASPKSALAFSDARSESSSRTARLAKSKSSNRWSTAREPRRQATRLVS